MAGLTPCPMFAAPQLLDCCSARGLHADRRDKLLKLLDTGGQNCTPNNNHVQATVRCAYLADDSRFSSANEPHPE